MERMPTLPVSITPAVREARRTRILRVYAHHHFRSAVDATPSLAALEAFHRAYKYRLMAHDQAAYRALGRLVAEGRGRAWVPLRNAYYRRLMAALSRPASTGNHCNVLLHLLGYFKRQLSAPVRRDILRVIEQYRRGEVTLVTPLTLLRHYVHQCGEEYLKGQQYLNPYPAALGLSKEL